VQPNFTVAWVGFNVVKKVHFLAPDFPYSAQPRLNTLIMRLSKIVHMPIAAGRLHF
jgi:hypothetical protein